MTLSKYIIISQTNDNIKLSRGSDIKLMITMQLLCHTSNCIQVVVDK